MQPEIASFIESKNIAVVGVSRNKRKFGNAIYDTLKERGYNVFPVHPEGVFYNEMKCFRSLEEVPPDVKAAVIATKPKNAEAAVDAAIKYGFEQLWFQQGSDFSKAAAKAREAGINVVTGKCILLYAAPVTGFHAFHRFLARLIGKW